MSYVHTGKDIGTGVFGLTLQGIGWILPIHTLDNATPFHETPSKELVEAKGVGAATPDDAMHGSTGS